MDETTAVTKACPHGLTRRRAFLISGAGLALPAFVAAPALAQPAGVPAAGQIAFRVIRKSADIGRHTVRFTQDGDALTVVTEVRITVKVGPVPVYHYYHRCTEHWSGGRFASMDSVTSSDGVSRRGAKARRVDGGVYVQPAVGDPYTAAADALPLTHWNHAIYQAGALFDPQDGRALHVTLVSKGDDTTKLADGSSVRATRYSVKGDSTMDDYYDEAGVWTGLHSRVQDGSYVNYLRL